MAKTWRVPEDTFYKLYHKCFISICFVILTFKIKNIPGEDEKLTVFLYCIFVRSGLVIEIGLFTIDSYSSAPYLSRDTRETYCYCIEELLLIHFGYVVV